jgi:hypothetical protein
MRPSNATITARTPNGVKFQWNLDNYRSKGARDASAESLEVLVAWSDADDFLEEAVGFTTWTGKNATFNRTVPLPHPLRPGFWCIEYELTDFGAYESRSDFNDPANFNAPAQDWCIYTLHFERPKWFVLTDKTLAGLASPGPAPEVNRYTWESDMPRPQSRIVSGFGLEYNASPTNDPFVGPWQTVPTEQQAVADYQVDVVINWVQIPIGAVPYDAILKRLNTVNVDGIQFVTGGRTWKPFELLFRGVARPLELYVGPDDNLYFDVAYRFTQQPGGWNSYLVRDAITGVISYQGMRVRTRPAAVGPGIPPYPLSNFYKLFIPAIDGGSLP